jgi:hypothetical protein
LSKELAEKKDIQPESKKAFFSNILGLFRDCQKGGYKDLVDEAEKDTLQLFHHIILNDRVDVLALPWPKALIQLHKTACQNKDFNLAKQVQKEFLRSCRLRKLDEEGVIRNLVPFYINSCEHPSPANKKFQEESGKRILAFVTKTNPSYEKTQNLLNGSVSQHHLAGAALLYHLHQHHPTNGEKSKLDQITDRYFSHVIQQRHMVREDCHTISYGRLDSNVARFCKDCFLRNRHLSQSPKKRTSRHLKTDTPRAGINSLRKTDAGRRPFS